MSEYNSNLEKKFSNNFENSAIKKPKTFEKRSKTHISSRDKLAVSFSLQIDTQVDKKYISTRCKDCKNFIMIIWRMECKYLSFMENIYQLVLKNFSNNYDTYSPFMKLIKWNNLSNLFKLNIFETLPCDYLHSFLLGVYENEDYDLK